MGNVIGMKLFGSAVNLTSIEKYGVKILEEAKMDYNNALSEAEVYLGEVFKGAAGKPQAWQIFDLEIDECRRTAGEKAVENHICKVFFTQLGYLIQDKYLPPDSPRWREIEGILGLKLDFAVYHSPENERSYVPAKVFAAKLFEYAIKGCDKIVIKWGNESGYKGKIFCAPPRKIKINPHFWRKWFYSLWGQNYEWGSFHVGEKMAEANEKVYYFDYPPQNVENRCVLNPGPVLEAHGFRVKVFENGRVEYWR